MAIPKPAAIALALAALLSGCTSSQSSHAATADHFTYSANMSSKTETKDYTWTNTKGAAHVLWSGQVAAGSMTVTIQDDAGKQVYSKTISGTTQSGATDHTGQGAPGTWSIRLEFKSYTGQASLTIDADSAH